MAFGASTVDRSTGATVRTPLSGPLTMLNEATWSGAISLASRLSAAPGASSPVVMLSVTALTPSLSGVISLPSTKIRSASIFDTSSPKAVNVKIELLASRVRKLVLRSRNFW